MINFSGIYAPIPTAFRDNEELALDKLEFNLRKWIASPLDGVVMPGSNSEAPYLTYEERVQIWQVCASTFEDTGKKFIAGTGVETTAETIRLTQKAGEMGAVATLLLPPHYFKQLMTHDALVKHYYAVADVSPIPILVYNMPAFTGIDISLETLKVLAEHPGIVGMKDSSSNVIKMGALLGARPDFQVLAGSGSAFLPYLSIGAVGGIMALANIGVVPLRKLADAFSEGRLEDAKKIQLTLVELNTAITAEYGVPGLKYAMSRFGFYGGPTRRPLLPASEKARVRIDQLLDEVQMT